MIQHPVLISGLDNTHGHTDQKGDHQGNAAQTHGYGKFGSDHLKNRSAVLNSAGCTKVKPQKLPIKTAQLLFHRIEQAGCLQLRILLLFRKLHHLILCKVVISWKHTHEQEHDSGDNQHCNHGLKQSFGGIFYHVLFRLSCCLEFLVLLCSIGVYRCFPVLISIVLSAVHSVHLGVIVDLGQLPLDLILHRNGQGVL